jgi:hypothetical protein
MTAALILANDSVGNPRSEQSLRHHQNARPRVRSLDMLTGEHVRSGVEVVLDAAVDRLREDHAELVTRNQELIEELAELKDRNLRLVNTVACMRTQLARAEAAK